MMMNLLIAIVVCVSDFLSC